jgi:Collagen triple helix repeat (20 copies)
MRSRIATKLMLLLLAVFSTLAQAQVVVTDDANTWSFSPKSNYGSSIALIVCSGSNTYLKFSFANLGSGVTSSNVSKATLVLYTDFVLTSGTMDVYQVSGSWSEGSITWNTAPALGTKLFSAVSVSKTGFLSLDLTPTVQAWLNGTLANNGIALVPSTGSAISVSFDSKENILTSHVAQLPLVLVSAGAQGPQGPQGPAGPQGTVGSQGPTGAQGPQGVMGLTGATGPIGPQGPAGTNGKGFDFTGPFSVSTAYNVDDVATYNGSSYVATVANQGGGTPDTNPTDWMLMAQQGATGTAGTPGAQGQPGPQGPQGTPGSPGAAGATGPQGPAGQQGIQGIIGLTGIGQTGATGPQGPQGQTGAAGIENKGNWNSGNSYNPGDSVFDAGSYWLATAVNTNSEPSPINTNWQLLAAGLNNRGSWNNSSNYNVNDAVTDQGSFWLALAANNNSEPAAGNSNWQQLAAQGATGAAGVAGPVGPTGPMGLPGLQGPPGVPPPNVAVTNAANTFGASQTITGNLILSGAGAAIQFADGTTQSTATTGGVPSGFTCPNGASIVGFNSDGSAICSQPTFAPAGVTNTRVGGPVSRVGNSAMAIGADGFPVVAFQQIDNAGNYYLILVHCGDFACAGGNTTSTLEEVASPNSLGTISLTIGSDGLPILSYEEYLLNFLRSEIFIRHCVDVQCKTSFITDEFSGFGPSSITINSTGSPIIAFSDSTSADLDLIFCGQVTCSGSSTPLRIAVNSEGNSLTLLHPTNYPMVSFSGGVAVCEDTFCSVHIYVSYAGVDIGPSGTTSLISGSDNLPVIAYATGSELAVVHCSTTTCPISLPPSSKIVLDTSPVNSASIFIGPQNLPIVAYSAAPLPGGDTTSTIKLINCGDVACSSGNQTSSIMTLTTGEVIHGVSLALGVDGLPVMSFNTDSSVYVAHCTNSTCSQQTIVRR